MKNYYPFRTIVVYENGRKAEEWIENFVENYSIMIKDSMFKSDRVRLILHDDSVIEVIPATESARGMKADRVYIDKNVNQFLKDNVFEPMRISQPLIEF